MISTRRKELATVLGLCLLIAYSIFRVAEYWRAPNYNVKLHRGVGEALAKEVIDALNRTGRVVVLTVDPAHYPALQTQAEAFRRVLKKQSSIVVARELLIDASTKRKVGPGVGLTSREFLELAKRAADADAIISLVGTPGPTDPEIRAYDGPPLLLIAETQARGKLKKLFERKLLHAAIVPRFTFPAPGPANPRTPEEWFTRSFQLVRPTVASSPELSAQ